MLYITFPASPRHSNVSLNELLFSDKTRPAVLTMPRSATVTYGTQNERFGDHLTYKHQHCVSAAIQNMEWIASVHQRLFTVPRESLYRTFHIPKKSGGLRQINAPNNELSQTLTAFKQVLEDNQLCGVLHHTAAFAYVKGRCTVDAVKKHQKNESKWFAKFDIHDFFGSTTKDFVLRMFRMVYPLNELIANVHGNVLFQQLLDLAFLNGGLPQGTPVSPTITNIMMVPFDAQFSKWCNENGFVYTRYADDMIVSCRHQFDFHTVENKIVEILQSLGAPFELNTSKTRYGSSKGRNWNLGVMLNAENNITVGHKAKRRFQSMLYNYVRDRRNGNPWSLEDIQTLNGLKSYYIMVEPEVTRNIIKHMSEKLNANIPDMIRADLAR